MKAAENLFAEVQGHMLNMQLQPSIRTCYSRSAFQLPDGNEVTRPPCLMPSQHLESAFVHSAAMGPFVLRGGYCGGHNQVRISLDTNIRMLNECLPKKEGHWCRCAVGKPCSCVVRLQVGGREGGPLVPMCCRFGLVISCPVWLGSVTVHAMAAASMIRLLGTMVRSGINDPLMECDVVNFPYAVLEMKLADAEAGAEPCSVSSHSSAFFPLRTAMNHSVLLWLAELRIIAGTVPRGTVPLGTVHAPV